MTRRRSLRALACSCFVLVLAASGCGGGGTATVSGTVKYKGNPVYGGQITLVGAKDAVAQGSIDFDGKYIVHGAPVGKVRVAVISPKPMPPRTTSRGEGRDQGNTVPQAPVGDPAKWKAVDPKYEDPNTSGKEITVASGKNENVDIDLE